tara:strand:- start:280 stop:666 length:387 start_codon:yes stop_codon:yes gene_type:complete
MKEDLLNRKDFDLFLKETNITEEIVNNWMKFADKEHLIENKSEMYRKDKSTIQGTGLFASRNLKVGENIGVVKFNDKRTTLARYTNHSGNPNIEFDLVNGLVIAYALENIIKNKELLVDYRHKKLKQN